MSKTWIISDTHFGHLGVCRFLDNDGNKIRPWTEDQVDQMDTDIINNINELVKENDKLYHLGDVVINRKSLWNMDRIVCKNRVLIKGNHDIFRLEDYTKYFRDIRSCHVLSGMILSHIPVHESQLERFKVNIHGHTHTNNVVDKSGKDDPRYKNVCVEKTNFKPVLLDELIAYKDSL